MAYCPNCGNELLAGAKFCVSCGRPVAESAAAAFPSAEETVQRAAENVKAETADTASQAYEEAGTASENAGAAPLVSAVIPAEEKSEGSGRSAENESRYTEYHRDQEAPEESSGREPEKAEAEQTLGQWVLTTFLSFLPIAGLVLLIIWSVSGETAPDKKNWARAMLIWHIVADVIAIIAVIAITAYFLSFYRYGLGLVY